MNYSGYDIVALSPGISFDCLQQAIKNSKGNFMVMYWLLARLSNNVIMHGMTQHGSEPQILHD